jgi:hypothetical protein
MLVTDIRCRAKAYDLRATDEEEDINQFYGKVNHREILRKHNLTEHPIH